jgi:hypothetical protein
MHLFCRDVSYNCNSLFQEVKGLTGASLCLVCLVALISGGPRKLSADADFLCVGRPRDRDAPFIAPFGLWPLAPMVNTILLLRPDRK